MKDRIKQELRNQEHSSKVFLVAMKGILAVAGAMILISFIIWATTSSGK